MELLAASFIVDQGVKLNGIHPRAGREQGADHSNIGACRTQSRDDLGVAVTTHE
jgi:hypothetical protein